MASDTGSIGETLAMEEEGEEDRISSLPDDVLSHILSYLPTKIRVSTTILSTRWINLYASVPILDFDDSVNHRVPTDVTPFIYFVYMVLSKVTIRLRHILKLRLSCGGRYDSHVVATWISLATFFNIQELDVSANLISSGLFPVPLPLLTCTTLVDLRLCGKFCLYVPHDVILPCLKRIELARVEMVGGSWVQRFFSGCPVLESLSLLDCVVDSVIGFELYVPTLKQLKVYQVETLLDFALNAPNLEYFEWDSYAARGYWWETLNFIKTAHLSVQCKDELYEGDGVYELFLMVTNTRSLKLDSDTMTALVYSNYRLPTFCNLTELSVYSNEGVGWELLPKLLDSSPHLEVLSFPLGLLGDDDDIVELTSFMQERVPTCISLHLKEVNYCWFNGEENEFKILEYFLKNAKMLEKMALSKTEDFGPESDSSDSDSIHITLRKQPLGMKRLLAFPRSSQACRISLHDKYV